MRKAKIRQDKQEGEVGVVCAHRNLLRSVAAEADLDEEIRRLGSVFEREKRGETERG
jgi:hypothetical protein